MFSNIFLALFSTVISGNLEQGTEQLFPMNLNSRYHRGHAAAVQPELHRVSFKAVMNQSVQMTAFSLERGVDGLLQGISGRGKRGARQEECFHSCERKLFASSLAVCRDLLCSMEPNGQRDPPPCVSLTRGVPGWWPSPPPRVKTHTTCTGGGFLQAP